MYQTVSRRLEHYEAGLSPELIDAVAEVADSQEGYSYGEFREALKVPDTQLYSPAGYKPVEVLDILPTVDEDGSDERSADVLFLPMGSGLTPNKILRAVTMARSDPSRRLIAFGNPGIPFQAPGGKVKLRQLPTVWRGDLAPTIESPLHYLNSQGIEEARFTGYSLGADKAVEASRQAERYDTKAVRFVAAEPVTVAARGLSGILKDFMSTDAGYREVLEAVDTPLLAETRRLSENNITYLLSLLRLNNITVASAMGRSGYQERVSQALRQNRELSGHTIWASQSELAKDGLMMAIAVALRSEFGYRSSHTRVKGQKHGMGDDIYLHAALMRHGLDYQAV